MDAAHESATDPLVIASRDGPIAIESAVGVLSAAVTRASVDGVDHDSLTGLLRGIRGAEAALASLLVCVATRADVLAERGEGAPAREFLLGDGYAVRGRQAGTEASRAELLGLAPGAAALLAEGRVSPAHLDVLARQWLPLTEEQRSRLAIEPLLATAEQLPVDTFSRHVGRAVSMLRVTPPPEDDLADGGGDDAAAADQAEDQALRIGDTKRAASWFRHWFDADTGMGHIAGYFDPERYEALTSVIDAHTDHLAATADEPTTKNANLAAAALVDLATNSGDTSGGGRRLPHVTVVVGQHASETGNGHPLTDHAVRRFLCDAVVQKVVLDEHGLPIDVGRRCRTATASQWTAVRALYRTCAWHRCERPLSWCQLHHVHEWENGGPTDLSNLVPLCSEHHHRVHEGKWSIALGEDRSLNITRANGSHYVTTDPPTRSG